MEKHISTEDEYIKFLDGMIAKAAQFRQTREKFFNSLSKDELAEFMRVRDEILSEGRDNGSVI